MRKAILYPFYSLKKKKTLRKDNGSYILSAGARRDIRNTNPQQSPHSIILKVQIEDKPSTLWGHRNLTVEINNACQALHNLAPVDRASQGHSYSKEPVHSLTQEHLPPR